MDREQGAILVTSQHSEQRAVAPGVRRETQGRGARALALAFPPIRILLAVHSPRLLAPNEDVLGVLISLLDLFRGVLEFLDHLPQAVDGVHVALHPCRAARAPAEVVLADLLEEGNLRREVAHDSDVRSRRLHRLRSSRALRRR